MKVLDPRAFSAVALGLVLGLLPGSLAGMSSRRALAFSSALVVRRGPISDGCLRNWLRCAALGAAASTPHGGRGAHRPQRPRVAVRGFRTYTQARVWGLPAPVASPPGGAEWDVADDIDWGEPSKEELVLEARLAGRDGVPMWAQSMTLHGQQVSLQSFKGKELPTYLAVDAFALTKLNMEEMYLSSMWGWDDVQKRGDLESHLARFFVATGERGELLGFIHYRFELVDNKFTHETSTAAYVLELQIVDSARRLGLGSLLMKAVHDIAVLKQMDSIMLCVFRYNGPAVQFYLNKMGYLIDQSSAFNDNQQDVWELVKPTPTLPPKEELLPSHPHDTLAARWKVSAAASETQLTNGVSAEEPDQTRAAQNLDGSVFSPKHTPNRTD